MPSLTSILRAARVIEHLLTGAAIALYVRAAWSLGTRPSWVPTASRWWHERLCRALGLRLDVSGKLAPGALLVANHVSWLDIPVLGAQDRMLFLSKAEVRRWPLIGWMAATAGTLFIARGANQATEIVTQIGERIRAGTPVVIFPEGTTTDGSRLQRFHPRLFSAAQQPGVRIQPVALRYGDGQVPDPIAPFVGDDDLLSHLVRVLSHPGLTVSVRFLPPLDAEGADRRRLAEQCRMAIADSLATTGTAVLGVDEVQSPALSVEEALGGAV